MRHDRLIFACRQRTHWADQAVRALCDGEASAFFMSLSIAIQAHERSRGALAQVKIGDAKYEREALDLMRIADRIDDAAATKHASVRRAIGHLVCAAFDDVTLLSHAQPGELLPERLRDLWSRLEGRDASRAALIEIHGAPIDRMRGGPIKPCTLDEAAA